jgi:hypothetical protein
MSGSSTSPEGKTDPTPGRAGESGAVAVGSKPSPAGLTGIPAVADAAKPGEPLPANSLTPAEQMERFAKELKENDWGHQPC